MREDRPQTSMTVFCSSRSKCKGTPVLMHMPVSGGGTKDTSAWEELKAACKFCAFACADARFSSASWRLDLWIASSETREEFVVWSTAKSWLICSTSGLASQCNIDSLPNDYVNRHGTADAFSLHCNSKRRLTEQVWRCWIPFCLYIVCFFDAWPDTSKLI